jgi:hypothetical protein
MLDRVADALATMAEAPVCGSRVARERNLDMKKARGGTREITGQGRYRTWISAQ